MNETPPEGVPCTEFGRGWVRVSKRRGSDQTGRHVDHMWISPEGERFNSRIKVVRHLAHSDGKVSLQSDENKTRKGARLALRADAAGAKEEGTWVECDRCGKWREVPDCYLPLPEVWYCELNPVEEYSSCDAPEQQWDEDDDWVEGVADPSSAPASTALAPAIPLAAASIGMTAPDDQRSAVCASASDVTQDPEDDEAVVPHEAPAEETERVRISDFCATQVFALRGSSCKSSVVILSSHLAHFAGQAKRARRMSIERAALVPWSVKDIVMRMDDCGECKFCLDKPKVRPCIFSPTTHRTSCTPYTYRHTLAKVPHRTPANPMQVACDPASYVRPKVVFLSPTCPVLTW